MKGYDVAIVGAGPAGTTAALRLAQKGLDVALIERGEFPGSKNMFGGMLPFCPVVEELIPGFWDKAPWERHVVRRILTVRTAGTSTSFAFEAEAFDQPPYSGYTLFRPVFDRWYGEQASRAGAKIVLESCVDDLLVRGTVVKGVHVARPEGDIHAKVTIACDGVLSFLAKKAGLRNDFDPSDMALGVKALLFLGEDEINRRFNLVRRQGVTHEFLGSTKGVRGGGFIYTQTETLSVGLVFHLSALKKSGLAPYDLLEQFMSSGRRVPRLLKGSRLIEYSAHVLPEGGYRKIPMLYSDGLLLAGDAAGLCYTNGINQEGMNLAIASGFLAAETVLDAFNAGDFSARQLSRYRDRLEESFVLKDMKTFESAVDLMHEDRLFSVYPTIVGKILENVYRSDGQPRKKPGRIGWETIKTEVGTKDLIRDLIKGGKSFL